MAPHPPRLHVLSLCSGIGGLELGIKRAAPHARCVAMVERETYGVSILQARMADGYLDEAPIWDDLTTFDARPWRGKVDCVTGGFPCQPFSAAGKRRGEHDPRHLWPYIARIVATIEPTYVFCENVPGLLTLGFEQVCKDLSGLGYSVEAGIYSAGELGAPHLRKRLYFLAYAQGAGRQTRLSHNLRVVTSKGSGSAACCRGPRHVADSQRKNVADAEYGHAPIRLPKQGGPQGGGKWAAGLGFYVADADCPRQLQSRWRISDKRRRPRYSGAKLSHPDSVGCSEGQPQSKVQQRGDGADSSGVCGHHGGPAQCGLGGADDGLCSGLDAPWGPDWERDVPRVVTGQPHRGDRLRALGNAVVPAVAAYAWQDLMTRVLEART